MWGLKSTISRAVKGLQQKNTVSSFSFLPERAFSSLYRGHTPTSRMLRSTTTIFRIASTSWALTPGSTLRYPVVATAMSPLPWIQRSHMRPASPPAPSSSFQMLDRLPQPVVASRVTAMASPIERRFRKSMKNPQYLFAMELRLASFTVLNLRHPPLYPCTQNSVIVFYSREQGIQYQISQTLTEFP